MYDAIVRIILEHAEDINDDLPRKIPLDRGPDAPLFGAGGGLDSIGLVSLLTAVEQDIEDAYDVVITIADERAFSRKHSPFATVGRLAEFIVEIVEAEKS